MLCIQVKTSSPSTRTAYSEICPIKWSSGLKQVTVEELEKDADCNPSVCM